MAEVKLEQTELCVAPLHLKEEPELCIKQEPEEFPFHIITVKIEEDEDEPQALLLFRLWEELQKKRIFR
uniref:Uncharacterized protein n=1 Tax=Knipowitschia caucasica TaxID=637954 RepID=A0AAV2LKS4_KNICA